MRLVGLFISILLTTPALSQYDLEDADNDLEFIKEGRMYQEVVQPISFYNMHVDLRDTIMFRAERAEKIYRKTAEEVNLNIEGYVNILEKLALSVHFQILDYSYQEGPEERYFQSLEVIKKAIKLEKDNNGITARLAELHLTAANLASPHFFWAYTSEEATICLDRSYEYMDEAAKIYYEVGEKQKAINCWRAIDGRNLDQSLKLIALTKEIEGDNSLWLACDISDLFHRYYYNDVEAGQRTQLEEYAEMAKGIFEQHTLSDYQQSQRIRMYRDIGYYNIRKTGNLEKALENYQAAQDIEIALGEDLYYIAFAIGAIKMQLKDYEGAAEQYKLAFTDERLSVTDTEHAWFGLAMISYITGDVKTAKELWKEKIGDTRIMNGVSEFSAYFTPSARPELKKSALELVDLVQAENAKRIITDGWN